MREWFRRNKETLFMLLAILVTIANYFGFGEYQLDPDVVLLINIILAWLFGKAAEKAQLL